MKKVFDVLSKTLILTGVSLLIYISFHFLQGYDLNDFSEFSSSVGGLIGSLWSLAGVLLFYLALTEQRKDIKINQETLKSQIKSLDLQVEEYKLQRLELEETRKVLKEQSNTLKIQQFESTFFNMMRLLQEIINELRIDYNGHVGQGRPFFKIAFDNFKDCFKQHNNTFHDPEELLKKQMYLQALMKKDKSHESEIDVNDLEKYKLKTIEVYDDFYRYNHDNLGHYFRFLYNIIKFTVQSELTNEEKIRYINLLKAQMSSYELGLVFYNSISKHGRKLHKWLEEYRLLENIDSRAILIPLVHIKFYPKTKFKFVLTNSDY